jgi:hypothetical protein
MNEANQAQHDSAPTNRNSAWDRLSRYWAIVASYWSFLAVPGAIGFAVTFFFAGASANKINDITLLLLILGIYLSFWTPTASAFFYRLINPDHVARAKPYVKRISPDRLRWIFVLIVVATILIAVAIYIDFGFSQFLYVSLSIALTALIGWAVLWMREELLKLHLPILFTAIYFLLLKSDQGIEAIRTTNETWWLPQTGLYFAWLLGCYMFSRMLGALGTHALGLQEQQPFTVQQRLALLLLVITPFASAGIVSWWALEQSLGETVSHRLDLVVCVFWTVSLILCVFFYLEIFADNSWKEPMGGILLANTSFFGAAALLPIFFLEMPPALFLPAWIGVTALVFFMFGNAGREVGLPTIFLLIVWGGLLSAFDLNDNHELTVAHKSDLTPELADKAFSKWLADVKDPKPVTAFVVVSEGGGARAAYVTAVALEALRARCSAFRRQHFATIAVSGGSLGATLTAIAPEPSAPDVDCKTIDGFDVGKSKAVATAGLDLLGPVLRGLSVDLLMRFWPSSLWRTDSPGALNELQRPWVSVIGDRTQYMESSLASFWTNWDRSSFINWPVLRPNELHNSLFSAAWAGPSGNTPALILLATDVGSGRRVAMSHLRFGPPATENCLSQSEVSKQPSGERARLLTLAEIAPRRDPTILGAALTSARFPFITPAATLPCPGVPWRLVDGGYFENSGLTTALELVDEMAKGSVNHIKRVGESGWKATDLQPKPVQVVLIRIENSDAAPPLHKTSAWFPELFSPLRAFGGTRDARADLARVAVDSAVSRVVYGPGRSSQDGACVSIQAVPIKVGPLRNNDPAWLVSF